MPEIRQSFTKGISRAMSREEFFDPEQFWAITNARILQTGNIGEIRRIKGYESISNEMTDLDVLYDIVKVDDRIVAFYKTTSAVVNDEFEYKIIVFTSEGATIESFTYRDSIEPKNRGELKQHEDSIFIAPHNKVLYNEEGSYILSDFISNVPKINNIVLKTENANKAEYKITVNETLAGYDGQRAEGSIKVRRNNFPEGVDFSLKVSIDGTESIETPEFNASTNFLTIRKELINAVNNTVAFDGVWEAEARDNNFSEIDIFAVNIGEEFNDVDIDVVGSNYIRTDKDVSSGVKEEGRIGNVEDIQDSLKDEFDFVNSLSTTFTTRDTRGGKDADSVSGTLSVTLKDSIVTDSITIVDTDTVEDIAQKLFNILSDSTFATEKYEISLIQKESTPTITDTIRLLARERGKKYNSDVIITINDDGVDVDLPDNFFTVDEVRKGTDELINGTLEPYTYYWYKARLVYIDGHITSTCSPRLIESGPNGIIDVLFDLSGVQDLDGGIARLQVYRRKEEEGFFLIEEVQIDQSDLTDGVYQYVDKGKSKIEVLQELTPLWTKSHESQEVLDNRLIKGNIQLFDEQYTVNDGDFTVDIEPITDDLERDVAPYNSKAQVYLRPQYTDGTKGFFTEIGDAFLQDSSAEISIQQNTEITDTEKEINNFEFFSRYLPYGEEKNVEFNSVEIQTPELQTIADPQEFSLQTQIFFGYKYIFVGDIVVDTLGRRVKKAYINVDGWNVDYDRPRRLVGEVGDAPSKELYIDDTDRLIANIHGTRKSYIPVAQAQFPEPNRTFTIYKLEMFDAIEDAVSTGNLFVRLVRGSRGVMSSTVDDNDLQDIRVRVTGIDDKTFGSEKFQMIDNNFDFYNFVPPSDSRIYLTLEESLLDKVNNKQLNEWDFKRRPPSGGTDRRDLSLSTAGKMAFTLINFEENTPADFDIADADRQQIIQQDDGDYAKFNVTPAKYLLINRDLTVDDQVIYIGQKPNEVDEVDAVTFDTTGFRFNLRSNLLYSRLAKYNIYNTLIKQSDFNFNVREFTNQVIWSNPLVENNYFSGGRNYETNNFYNIPSENGEIIDIVSLGGNLYAFCERGVARLFVGETLTQQKSGQVFIDSSGFITKHVWMLENTPDIKRDSIVKRDNGIYWTDGNDVYQITEQGMNNISQGVLNLDSSVNYFASFVNKYDEYRLCGDGKMFVYNTKYQVWYGPHTYTPFKTVEVDGNIVSYKDGLIKEDVGNTFDGEPYETIIQSVGNDTEVGAIDKTYRKFYFSLDGDANTTFKYGKDFNSLISKSVTDLIVKNGSKNVGIKNTEGNTKKIYWEFTTTNADFSLKGFRTSYILRRRR